MQSPIFGATIESMAKDWGWPIDPTMTGGYGYGIAPDGHPRRCQAAKRRKHPPQQCRQWAMRGRNYCKSHGGRQPLSNTKHLSYYSKHAGKALSTALEEIAGMDPDERNSIAQEVDIARMLATQSLKNFSAVFLKEHDEKTSKNLEESGVKPRILENCWEAINNVSEIVAKSAMIRYRSESVVGLEDVQYVINQVLTILQRLGVEEDLLAELKNEFKTIRLPKRGAAMDADQAINMLREMDDSVANS